MMRRSGLLRMDMHLHTHRSYDCLSRPADLLAAAERRGIDRLIVTDHNEIDGALELKQLDPERILVGEEVKTREGYDIIGILLEDRISRGTPARETCERIRAQGGVVYLPHPFDGARGGGRSGAFEDILDLVDVVEVHNARCLLPRFNRRAMEWARLHGKLHGYGSDAHTCAEIGASYVEVPEFEQTRASLLEALARGRPGATPRTSPLFRLASTWAKVRKKV